MLSRPGMLRYRDLLTVWVSRPCMAVLALVFAGMLSMGQPLAGPADTLAVVVPKTQSGKIGSLVDLSLIYWRKKLYWSEGVRMQPVNLPTDSPQRRQFSQRVLGSLPETQAEYWNEVYYHGTTPPHVVSSQEAVLRYVADTPGGIGYVDACKVDSRVKAVAWLLGDGSFTTSPPALSCPP
ncbi:MULTISPECIES: hypothetical protein [Methylovorus]|uniref:Uncharacterized protein n=1 Tax=Methylovorus glucosotrophus (strain SIP3-4) TaxID=582744 RepID=C6XB90_METGS|nr:MULTISPECIES: hypothetical protein [Methylovorus]ACT51860.1 hypothetical protein Msip34_2623 [Methylovorus glucosotrophus SIP3-4]